MGFLEKLWDETLAGPKPEFGLGRLRKQQHLEDPFPSSSTVRSDLYGGVHMTPVTRAITLRRPHHAARSPTSPSGPSSPFTPLTPRTPTEDSRKFTRKKHPMPMEGMDGVDVDPRSPTVYDWIIISALDR